MAGYIVDRLIWLGSPRRFGIVYFGVIHLRVLHRTDNTEFDAFCHSRGAAHKAFRLYITPAPFDTVAHIIVKNGDLIELVSILFYRPQVFRKRAIACRPSFAINK